MPRYAAVVLIGLAALVLAVSAQAQMVETLISNTGQGSTFSYKTVLDRAQPFTTGANSGGYTLSSVEIISLDTEGDDAALSVCTVDDNDFPTSDCTALTVPASSTAGTLEFTGNMTLAADTTYTLLLTSPGGENLNLGATSSDNEDLGGAQGWSIANVCNYKSFDNWRRLSAGLSLRITIKGAVVASTNNAPAFPGMSTARSFAETAGDATVQSAGNVGAAVTATDQDNDTLAYSLEGTDAGRFTIVSGSGQILTKVGESYDRETKASYSVMVKADDSNGGTDTIAVTLNVTDQDEAPVAPAVPSVTSTSGSTTSVNVMWSAPSNTGRPAITSYDLQYRQGTSGNWSNGPQDVTTTSTSIGSLDKDTEYQVQVRASNSDGDGTWSEPGTGRTRGNRAPAFPGMSTARSFAETAGDATVQSAGNVGAAVTATDQDNDTLAYSLEGTDAGRFTIVSGSGQILTKVGESYDRETKASYSVMVKADDSNGGTDTIAVTLNVTDQDEAPVAPAVPSVTSTSGSTTSVNVMWSAPSNTGRPAITSYDLQYREGMTGNWMDGPQDVNVTNSPIMGLKEDTEYQVQVRATNDEGDSLWSPRGRGRPMRPPTARRPLRTAPARRGTSTRL